MTVLFLCRQNAGRSQMAHAFFERLAPKHRALSGGSAPAAAVHPAVIDAMREVGIDLSGRKPSKVDAEMLAMVARLAALPANAPGADKTWVLLRMRSIQRLFSAPQPVTREQQIEAIRSALDALKRS